MNQLCPVCDLTDTVAFMELPEMPVLIGVQHSSREDAVTCAKGDVCLVFCRNCGFIWNDKFQPDLVEYSSAYDNSLESSPVFQKYASELAHRLIDTYDVREGNVVELGCGKGYFLDLLCQEGNNRGFGFDTSYDMRRPESSSGVQISYYQEYYGPDHHVDADLICCRQVLEHIQDPVAFLSSIRKTIGPTALTTLYFEVPNVRFILQGLSIWDIIYEHCSYFAKEPLVYMFRECGFELTRAEDSYAGQFLSIDARAAMDTGGSKRRREDVSQLAEATSHFASHVDARISCWQEQLEEMSRKKQRVVLWGGGAKAVSFLNMLKGTDAIRYVVDVNPAKEGKYIPGGGQQIVSPDSIREFRPEIVILMNPIYKAEVQQGLDDLGVRALLLEG